MIKLELHMDWYFFHFGKWWHHMKIKNCFQELGTVTGPGTSLSRLNKQYNSCARASNWIVQPPSQGFSLAWGREKSLGTRLRDKKIRKNQGFSWLTLFLSVLYKSQGFFQMNDLSQPTVLPDQSFPACIRGDIFSVYSLGSLKCPS